MKRLLMLVVLLAMLAVGCGANPTLSDTAVVDDKPVITVYKSPT